MKLVIGFVGLVVTCSSLCADESAAGAPDPKDMKGMTQLTPPPASDAGYYVGAYGGAQFATAYGNNRQTIYPVKGFGTNITTTPIHSNWGWVGGVKFGYMFDSQPLCDWMNLRWQPAVEAEGIYIGDNSHATSLAGPGSHEEFSTNSGDFFVNGVLRLKNSSLVTPYFGVGAGLQYFTSHTTLHGPTGGFIGTGLDTSDLDFAAQALAGFDFRLCDHASIFTEYKFIDAIDNDSLSTNLPASNTFRFRPDQIQQHLITAGVKCDF